MQHPVGYTIRNGRAELTDFTAVLTNEFGLLQIVHTIPSAFLLAAFFVMGISAWHLLKHQHIDFFTRSFNIGLVVGLVSSIVVALTGDLHAVHVTETQPAKLAAMEAHWETQAQAPIVLFAVPDAENERNAIEIGRVPGLLSLLGHHDANATVTGLKDIPKDERPPVALTFVSFRIMVALGAVFLLLTIVGMFLKNRLLESRWFLWIMLFAIPLPYLAIEAGWVLAEVGRQPWIVYGLLKTADAASPVAGIQVMTTLAGFILVYGLLGLAGFYLMARYVIKGPEPAVETA
jgi:cytochrome d ubiquinol oxidase subunit I